MILLAVSENFIEETVDLLIREMPLLSECVLVYILQSVRHRAAAAFDRILVRNTNLLISPEIYIVYMILVSKIRY